MRGMRRPSRRLLLPLLRPLAGILIILFSVVRLLLPTAELIKVSASADMLGLKNGSLRRMQTDSILRHFHRNGNFEFHHDNVPGIHVETVPMTANFDDLKDDVFSSTIQTFLIL